MERTQVVGGETSVVRYGFSAGGDTPDLVMDGAAVSVAIVCQKASKKGSTEKGNRRAKNTGKTYGSSEEAERAAKDYAGKHPQTCRYRGPCSSGGHVHVDKKVKGSKKTTTRHYYW